MKIRGNGERVNRIELMSKSLNVRFNSYCTPINPTLDLPADWKDPSVAEFIFEDLHELDDLINMLEKFRKASLQHLGLWEGRITWEEGMSKGEGLKKLGGNYEP